MWRALLIILAYVGGSSLLWADGIPPTKLTVEGRTYRLAYQTDRGSAATGRWHGLVYDDTGVQGTLLLLEKEEGTRATGTLVLGERRYRLHATRTSLDLHLLPALPPAKVDQLDYKPSRDDLPFRRRLALQNSTPRTQPVAVDVMMLYTPAARAHAGGETEIRESIELALAETDQAFRDSGVLVSLNVVHLGEIAYTESNAMETDLQRLGAQSDGHMDEVHRLRTQYGADMVALFVDSPSSAAGFGYVLTGRGTDAFSVVQARFATGYHVLTHELGHNFGCAHDRDHATAPGATPYAYGYRFRVGSTVYRTIMAYDPGVRLGYFSNPDKSFLGTPVGTANENNARVINERAEIIAGAFVPPAFSLRLRINGSGKILRDGVALSATTLTIPRGERVRLQAEGEFVGWTGETVSDSANLELTLNRHATLTAHFRDGPERFAPELIVQPASRSLPLSAPLQLDLAAISLPEARYQWTHNGRVVGQDRTYRVASVGPLDQGVYRGIASNELGQVTTRDITVLVGETPKILQQPVAQLVQIGGSTLFSVLTDVFEPRYQWYFNNQALPLATNRHFALFSIRAEDVGSYHVEISSAHHGVLVSDKAELLLLSPPVITRQPERLAITRGESARFSVEAQGLPPLQYQWQLNGRDVAGQTRSVLELLQVQPEQAGPYRVLVSNPHGLTYSTQAVLVVYHPLTIGQPPVDLLAVRGSTPIFSVQATGSAPITYQWFREGVPLQDQVYPTCRLRNVAVAASGTYHVEITNPSGTVRSPTATLTVLDPPTFVTQPQSITADEGSRVTFRVATDGKAPITYAWFKNGTAIPDATEPELALATVGRADLGRYKVIARNGEGETASQEAILALNFRPTLVVPPTDTVAVRGGGARFIARADGVGPMNYRWFHNGQPLDAAGETLILDSLDLSQAGTYTVTVWNRLGTVTSAPAELTIKFPPEIAPLPERLQVDHDSELVLKADVVGLLPLTYSWRRNGVEVGTDPIFRLAPVTPLVAGNYSVQVRNADGLAQSTEVRVTVETAPRLLSALKPLAVEVGATASFTVEASGAAPLTYHWQRNAAWYATGGPTLTLPSIQLNHEGDWSVFVSNRLGSVQSEAVGLKISYPPRLTLDLTPQSIVAGKPATFTVAATGREPFQFSWTRNGTLLQEGPESSLTVPSAQRSDAGLYRVTVRNADGATASASVPLTVLSPPVFVVHPSDVSALRGQSPVLTASASSSTTVSYQWYQNDLPVEGANQASLALVHVGLEHAGRYFVTASNVADVVRSQEAIVTVKDPPRFTVQPTSVTALLGSKITLTAEAVSSVTPIVYEWKHNLRPIQGASAPTLSFELSAAAAGAYVVEAKNADGSAVSAEAWVLPQREPPVLRTDLPALVIVGPKQGLRLEVEVDGRRPFKVQWYKNGKPVSERNALIFVIGRVDENDAGDYSVSITNDDGSVTSQIARVKVFAAPPKITESPDDRLVPRFSSTEFAVKAENIEGATFQWYRNGKPIEGAQSPTLVIARVDDGDIGGYSVRIVNAFGAAQTRPATLKIIEAPRIITHPKDYATDSGESAGFKVKAVGQGSLRYQWYFNGEPITGADNGGLQLFSVQLSHAGGYSVAVANDGGTNHSRIATLTVRQSPRILSEPRSVVTRSGETASFQVSASGRPPLSYQWLAAGQRIAGATQETLTLPGVTKASPASYAVVVSNADGQATSATATLTVQEPPTIVRQPSSTSGAIGERLQLSVAVSSDTAPTYTWTRDGSVLAHATGATLTLASAQTTDEGDYAVLIRNQAGETRSETARVRVNQPPIIEVQPLGQTVILGRDYTLTVTARGRQPMLYRWDKLGVPIHTSTLPNLVLTAVAPADLAAYRVTVNNDDGEALSDEAVLHADASQTPPAVVRQPQDTLTLPGRSAALTVQAVGAEPFSYQWHREGVALPGQTGSTLAFNPVATDHAGSYTVVVSNVLGQTESTPARLDFAALPAITAQPSDVAGVAGQPFGLEVTVRDTAACYWYLGSALAAQTADGVLAWPELQTVQQGTYTLIASNAWGIARSAPITLTVLTPPRLVEPPANAHARRGASATFRARATGSGPLTYQWFRDELPLLAASSPELTLSALQPNDTGSFRLRVSNPHGSVDSPTVTLTVTDPPVITASPERQTVNQGSSATLNVRATGGSPLTYQWFHDGTPLSGATEPVLTLPVVDSYHEGRYSAVVRNPDGSATSEEANLTVRLAPFYLDATQTTRIPLGSTLNLTANVGGALPLSFQWLRNGEPIPGATANAWTLSDATLADEGTYSLAATNDIGSIIAHVTILEVSAPPVIVVPPQSQEINPGDTVTFQVEVGGRSPFAYQWKKNGAVIPQAVLASFSLENVGEAEAGNYSVAITNNDGASESRAAVLSVRQPPTLLQPLPASLRVAHGSSTQLVARVTGTAPISFQWFKDDQPIPGATQATLTLASAAVRDAGAYAVRAENPLGTLTSSAIEVHVVHPPVILTHPSSQTVRQGATLALEVVADGKHPMTYAWTHNGNRLPHFQNRVLLIDNVQPSHAGNYAVTLTNEDGQATSTAATVSLQPLPEILAQPLTAIVTVSNVFQLEVTAQSPSPMTYQWRRNGVAIAGAVAPLLAVESAVFGHAGTYDVLVSNRAGYVQSEPAQVIVLPVQPLRVGKDSPQGQILHIVPIETGGIAFLFHGAVGRTYEVQASDNFTTWSTVQTLKLTKNLNTFIDPKAGEHSLRTYRLRSVD